MLQFYQPRKLVFGNNAMDDFISCFTMLPYSNIFLVADPHMLPVFSHFSEIMSSAGKSVQIFSEVYCEPGYSLFTELRNSLEQSKTDAVIGIGGGSILDLAKLLAALSYTGQTLESAVGIGNILKRELFLACLPTTAGSGSEVSPNAILLDEKDSVKKGFVSEFLVPDMTYIDPVLTHSVPPSLTAATGIDALTHCIEAFANIFAHPITDLYALEGVKLILNSLETACNDGDNAQARENIARGSLYGGLCLGPVNTAAVHALAYPLNGKYQIPHGVSNAILLPHVMRMNLPEAAGHYAVMGKALDIKGTKNDQVTAMAFIQMIEDLCRRIGIPNKLTAFNVDINDVPKLSKSAIGVQRLLKNNLHQLSEEEISTIYYQLF